MAAHPLVTPIVVDCLRASLIQSGLIDVHDIDRHLNSNKGRANLGGITVQLIERGVDISSRADVAQAMNVDNLHQIIVDILQIVRRETIAIRTNVYADIIKGFQTYTHAMLIFVGLPFEEQLEMVEKLRDEDLAAILAELKTSYAMDKHHGATAAHIHQLHIGILSRMWLPELERMRFAALNSVDPYVCSLASYPRFQDISKHDMEVLATKEAAAAAIPPRPTLSFARLVTESRSSSVHNQAMMRAAAADASARLVIARAAVAANPRSAAASVALLDAEEDEDENVLDGYIADSDETIKHGIFDCIRRGRFTPDEIEDEDHRWIEHDLRWRVIYCADLIFACHTFHKAPYHASNLATAFKSIIAASEAVPLHSRDRQDEWICNGAVLLNFMEMFKTYKGTLPTDTNAKLEESLLFVLNDEAIGAVNRMHIVVQVLAFLGGRMKDSLYRRWSFNQVDVAAPWMRTDHHPGLTMDDDDVDSEPSDDFTGFTGITPVAGIALIVRGGYAKLVDPFINTCILDSGMRQFMNRDVRTHEDQGARSEICMVDKQLAVFTRALVSASVTLDDPHPLHIDALSAVFQNDLIKERHVHDPDLELLLEAAPRGNIVVQMARQAILDSPDSTDLSRAEQKVAWDRAMASDKNGKWYVREFRMWYICSQFAADSPARLIRATRMSLGPMPTNEFGKKRMFLHLERLLRVDIKTGSDPFVFITSADTRERMRKRFRQWGIIYNDLQDRLEHSRSSRRELVRSVTVAEGALVARGLPLEAMGLVNQLVAGTTPTHSQTMTEQDVKLGVDELEALIPPPGVPITLKGVNHMRSNAFKMLSNAMRSPTLFVRHTGVKYSMPGKPISMREHFIRLLRGIVDARSSAVTREFVVRTVAELAQLVNSAIHLSAKPPHDIGAASRAINHAMRSGNTYRGFRKRAADEVGMETQERLHANRVRVLTARAYAHDAMHEAEHAHAFAGREQQPQPIPSHVIGYAASSVPVDSMRATAPFDRMMASMNMDDFYARAAAAEEASSSDMVDIDFLRQL